MRLVFHRCFLRIFLILGDTWQLRLSHARGMLLLHSGGFGAYNYDKGKDSHLKETTWTTIRVKSGIRGHSR